MDALEFDQLTRLLSTSRARRGLARGLAALPLAGGLSAFLAAHEVDAGQRQRMAGDGRRQARVEACIPTGKACPSKKPRGRKGKKLSCNHCCQKTFATDASGKRKCACQPNGTACTADSASSCCTGFCDAGTCQQPSCDPPCGGATPICQNLTCVACSASAPCPSGQLCLEDGSCQPCDVSCPSGDAAACGAALQEAIAAGGTVYVCPGRYTGRYDVPLSLALIGAGQGDDPAVDTILDARGIDRVIRISLLTEAVELARLRITGGDHAFGAGIFHGGMQLLMRDSTVTGNVAGTGGGIAVATDSILVMTRCTVRSNQADLDGGGIVNDGTVTLETSTVTGNTSGNAPAGIANFETVNLNNSTVSGNAPGNCGGTGTFNGSGCAP